MGEWPADWGTVGFCPNFMLLELFPIIVAVEIWGEALHNKRVCF